MNIRFLFLLAPALTLFLASCDEFSGPFSSPFGGTPRVTGDGESGGSSDY